MYNNNYKDIKQVDNYSRNNILYSMNSIQINISI